MPTQPDKGCRTCVWCENGVCVWAQYTCDVPFWLDDATKNVGEADGADCAEWSKRGEYDDV